MSGLVDRVLLTLEAGRVARYHAAPTVAPQSVGLHSYGVAVLCLHLCGGCASAELLQAALLHDAPEIITGDVPYTTKRNSPTIKHELEELEERVYDYDVLPFPKLTQAEVATLKLADTLDGLIWCHKTENRGPVLDRWAEAMGIALQKYAGVVEPDVLMRAKELAEAGPFTGVKSQY